MKQADIIVGGLYRARVSGLLTDVRTLRELPESYFRKGKRWEAVNVATGRYITVSAARLRRLVGEPTTYDAHDAGVCRSDCQRCHDEARAVKVLPKKDGEKS